MCAELLSRGESRPADQLLEQAQLAKNLTRLPHVESGLLYEANAKGTELRTGDSGGETSKIRSFVEC